MRGKTKVTSRLSGWIILVGAMMGAGACTRNQATAPPTDDQIIPTVATACASWDDGDLGGWVANTIQTSVSVLATGGEDGGYLRSTTPAGGWGVVGAVALESEFCGDYSAKHYDGMTASLQFSTGDYANAVFRVRYLDARYNGWFIPLACDLSSHEWQRVSVKFKPDWSDAEARAAGWVQESRSASFSETMAHVYHAGIRCQGTGALVLGIDNFCLVTGGS